MIAYSLIKESKNRKELRNSKEANKYFEILSEFERTNAYPVTKIDWKSKRLGKDCFRRKYRAGGCRGILVNKLTEKELEIIVSNPYYALKYSKIVKKRFGTNLEYKLLNEFPEKVRPFRSSMDSLSIVLDYCDKFQVPSPASLHNRIIFECANGGYSEDGRILNGGSGKHKGKSWREIPKEYHCKYRRYLTNYENFVNNISNFLSKKRIDLNSKISDLLKRKLSKNDRRYLETFINVQMLQHNDVVAKLIETREAA
jgi:hypothetical protein